jgi:hypothetical protein
MKGLRGFGGLGKMGGMRDEKPNLPNEDKGKKDSEKVEKGKTDGESNDGGEKVHTITEHGDGSVSTKTHEGEEEHHPDHLHALAHLGHHITGGDKHHIAHHDGMGVSTHGIHESGEHEETLHHEDAEQAGEHMKGFMGGSEGDEPEEHDNAQEENAEAMPSYGGMS